MSSHDYFNQQPTAQPYAGAPGQPPYYEASYLNHQSSNPSYAATPSADHAAVSPFEAPFDDHVYPSNIHAQDSQQSFGQDSQYISQGGGTHDPAGAYRDDIPLQNNISATPMYSAEATDHVYDIPPGHPQEQRRKWGGQRNSFASEKKGWWDICWVVWIFTLAQCGTFIGQLARNAELTGSPIMIHPSFNPMIGPSTYVSINMGARFVECMHNVEGVTDASLTIAWPCPNTTSSDPNNPSNQCTLSELCGFGGVPNPVPGGSMDDEPQPNQWFRFILPMFLHAGIVHIGFNMILQCTLGREMETKIGHVRFFLVYVSSGIFGFVMGGNFAASGIASMGCSGCLFGIIALNLLDLLYTWHLRVKPWRELFWIMLDIVISFVLGLLPGLDNFSHIGGFCMGIVLGICILRSPVAIRKHTGEAEPPYTPVTAMASTDLDGASWGLSQFLKSPIGYFKGRKGAWWAWWLLRAGALAGILISFILLLDNFYIYHKTCSWCKYLSCLPVDNWCSIGTLQLTNSTSKRSLLEGWEERAYLVQQ